MKRLPIAILISAALWTGCGHQEKADVWRAFDECTALYNASDTPAHGPPRCAGRKGSRQDAATVP